MAGNVLWAMRYVYMVNRALTLIPFSVQLRPGADKYAALYRTRDVALIVLEKLLVLVAITYMLHFFYNDMDVRQFDKMIMSSGNITMCANNVINSFLFIVHRETFVSVLNCSSRMSQRLRSLRVEVDYRVVEVFAMRLLLVVVAAMSVLVVYSLRFTDQLGYIFVFSNLYILLVTMSPLMILFCLLYDISYKYKLLCAFVRRLHAASAAHGTLVYLLGVDDLLREQAAAVNHMFDLCILSTISNCYISGAVTIFVTTRGIEVQGIDLSLGPLIWLFYTIFITAFIIANFVSLREQSDTFMRLLISVRFSITDEQTKEQIEWSLLALRHRRFAFTACKLYPLDYTTLLAVFGTIGIYMSILHQFSNMYT